MRKRALYFIFLCSFFWIHAQEGFHITTPKKRVTIPFQQINNLIFIPVTVNGVPLLFLLDSGVVDTILFSLDDTEQVELHQVETLSLVGLGSKSAISALKSKGNKLVIADRMVDANHDILVVLEEAINFSNFVGIPVNGILGYHFFKNHCIEIDYENKRLFVTESFAVPKKKFRNFEVLPIRLEGKKPYAHGQVKLAEKEQVVKLLVDTGNSDAIWLFGVPDQSIPQPKINDFLGVGFSGAIYGSRARLPQFQLQHFKFENPLVAFPDTTSLRNVTMVADRAGSIGAEILRRFTVVFDYQANRMYLKKNTGYPDVFVFNKSGLEIQLKEKQWVPETIYDTKTIQYTSYSTQEPMSNIKFKMAQKPIYSISNVRANSAGSQAGLLKDDVLLTINNRSASSFTLQRINNLFKGPDGKKIKIKVDRNGQILTRAVVLKSVL